MTTKSKILKRLASNNGATFSHKRHSHHHHTHNTSSTTPKTTTAATVVVDHPPPPSHLDVTIPTTTAPKRSKLTRLSVKTRRVQPIDRNPDGSPKLPQQIGVLTVLSLGTIVTDRPTFHNERYIFPVGYTVSR